MTKCGEEGPWQWLFWSQQQLHEISGAYWGTFHILAVENPRSEAGSVARACKLYFEEGKGLQVDWLIANTENILWPLEGNNCRKTTTARQGKKFLGRSNFSFCPSYVARSHEQLSGLSVICSSVDSTFLLLCGHNTKVNKKTKRLRWSRVSVMAFGTQVRGFTSGRSRRIFRAKNSSACLHSDGK